MLIKIENGIPTQWPINENVISAHHPNTSFSFPLSEETLKQFGYATFHYSDPPQYDADLQEAKEVAPALIAGKWTQQWEIVERYTEEEKVAKKAERAAQAATWAATQYQRERMAAYPSFADQFDLLYHGGINAWKTAIQMVKDKYPKPE